MELMEMVTMVTMGLMAALSLLKAPQFTIWGQLYHLILKIYSQMLIIPH